MSKKKKGKKNKNRRRSDGAGNRSRAANHRSGGGSNIFDLPTGTELFSIKAGQKTFIDILNYEVGKGNPWKEEGKTHYERSFFIHRNIGAENTTVICPSKSIGKRCPICEHRAKLMQAGDYDKKIVQALKVSEQQIFNIVDHRDDMKVKVWQISNYCFGKQLDSEIDDSDKEDGYDLFDDPDKGFTLRLGIDEESGGTFKFPKVNRIAFKKRKPLDDELLEQALCLDDLLVIQSYEDLKKLLFQEDDIEDDDEDDFDKPKKKKGKGKKKAAPEPDEDEDDEDLEDEDDEADDDEADDDADDDDGEDEEEADDDSDDEDEADDDSDDGDEEEDDDDDGEDEDDEEDDEEDEKPAPKKKKKGKGKKTKVVEEEDDDDGDDWDLDDEDDEDPAPKKKKKAKGKKPAAKKTTKKKGGKKKRK